MRAFQTGKVTKAQLLESLERHRDQDSFRKGAFWNEDTGTGCGVGCSIHDFSPGAEQNHTEYETLFGIPAELAVLEEHIFETLRYDARPPRPGRMAPGIRPRRTGGRRPRPPPRANGPWPSSPGEDSPLAHARDRAALQGRCRHPAGAGWTRVTPGPQFQLDIDQGPTPPLARNRPPLHQRRRGRHRLRPPAKTKDGPYTTEDMLLLTHIHAPRRTISRPAPPPKGAKTAGRPCARTRPPGSGWLRCCSKSSPHHPQVETRSPRPGKRAQKCKQHRLRPAGAGPQP